MPNVKVSPDTELPSHDVSLSDGVEAIGLMFTETLRPLQEIPISEGARSYRHEQKSWFSGLGRLRFQDDPMGYWDAYSMWTMTDGKLFPMPQWSWGSGYRDADFSMPGDGEYQKIDTYIEIGFTAGASYNADKALLWLDWVGAPGALSYALMSDSGGDPDSVLKSGTIATTAATRYGPTELDWSGTQALVASTDYHLRIYQAGDQNNYWSVLVDADGAGSQTSADGATGWTAAAYSLYYRVVDADVKREWLGFRFKGATYAVSINDAATNSVLMINGDRGKATSATSTTLTETAAGVAGGWTADMWIGAWVRITAGTGAGQTREITDNDTTTLTVATWDKTPSTDSEYVIYSTPRWQTLTAGLGVVTGKPLAVGEVVYFPQGATTIRKMEVDYSADQHAFSNDSTNTADRLAKFHNTESETEIWGSDDDLSKVKYAAEATYDTTLSFRDWKKAGSSPVITNLLSGEDHLYIMKEDGYYTLSPSRTILPKWERNDSIDPNNGKAAMWFNNEFWFSWANSLQRWIKDTDDVSDMLLYRPGTQGLPRPGIPACATFGIGWRFFAIDGGSSKISSVIVFNGYGYQEVLRGWKNGARIRNVFWQNCPGTRNRLWCDCNGELIYIDFPLDAANPRRDTGLNYQHFAEFISSTFDGNEQTLYKLLATFRANLEGESSNITVYYQWNDDVGTNTWYEIGQIKNVDRKEFNIQKGYLKEYRIKLRFDTTDADDPPVMNSYSTEGQVAAELRRQWVSSFRVAENQLTYTSVPDFKPDDVVEFLSNAAERAESLYLRSRFTTMDDKRVIVGAPAINREKVWVLDGKTRWDGTIDVALREA